MMIPSGTLSVFSLSDLTAIDHETPYPTERVLVGVRPADEDAEGARTKLLTSPALLITGTTN